MKSDSTGGIYAIRRIRTGDMYIGSARDIPQRFREHRSALSRGIHHSRYLQRAWNKYGSDAFEFVRLVVCEDESALFPLEQRFLDVLDPAYNLNPSATGTRGLRWTTKQREALRPIRRAQATKEVRKRISEGVCRNLTGLERIARAKRARAGWTKESRRKQIEKLTGRRYVRVSSQEFPF